MIFFSFQVTMTGSSTSVIRLYRTMLREGSKFENYNFRVYTMEKIRKTFHQNKNEADSSKIETLIKSAKINLDLIKRQTTIGKLYVDTKVVIEKH